jgi:hypothetical protein
LRIPFDLQAIFASAAAARLSARWDRARLAAEGADRRGALPVPDEAQRIPGGSEAVKRFREEGARVCLKTPD